jgi:hypothetical protein
MCKQEAIGSGAQSLSLPTFQPSQYPEAPAFQPSQYQATPAVLLCKQAICSGAQNLSLPTFQQSQQPEVSALHLSQYPATPAVLMCKQEVINPDAHDLSLSTFQPSQHPEAPALHLSQYPASTAILVCKQEMIDSSAQPLSRPVLNLSHPFASPAFRPSQHPASPAILVCKQETADRNAAMFAVTQSNANPAMLPAQTQRMAANPPIPSPRPATAATSPCFAPAVLSISHKIPILHNTHGDLDELPLPLAPAINNATPQLTPQLLTLLKQYNFSNQSYAPAATAIESIPESDPQEVDVFSVFQKKQCVGC